MIIARIKQVDGGQRILIGSAAAKEQIDADPTMIDAGLASIIVDVDRKGAPWAMEWPGRREGRPVPWGLIDSFLD